MFPSSVNSPAVKTEQKRKVHKSIKAESQGICVVKNCNYKTLTRMRMIGKKQKQNTNTG